MRRASKLLRHAGKPEPRRYLSWFALMDGDARAHVFERLFAEAPSGLTQLGRLQWVDLHSFVTDNLMLKADRLSMAHSLELRVPLLDHEVVEAGLGLPDREKVNGVRTKVAIRHLVERPSGPRDRPATEAGLRSTGGALAAGRPARPERGRDRVARRASSTARLEGGAGAAVRADNAGSVAARAPIARA